MTAEKIDGDMVSFSAVPFMEKLHEWMDMKQQEGVSLTRAEISEYLQNKLDYGGEVVSMSPISQPPKLPSPNLQFPFLAPSSQMQQRASGPAIGLRGPGGVNMDQPEDSVCSNAMYGPVGRNLSKWHQDSSTAEKDHKGAMGPKAGRMR